jgi:acyl-CoA thioesterase FadM
VLTLDVGIRRWGRTSFDIGFEGKVGDRLVFDATITYVSVTPGTVEPIALAQSVRDRLGEL